MIIEPKSTRQGSEPLESRKRFEFNTPERLSRVPLYVALFVVAIAAYIKSAFAQVVEGPAAAAAAGGDDAAAPKQKPIETAQIEPPQEIDETVTGSIDEGAGPQNRVGRGLPWDTEFLPPESPALVFARTFEPYQMAIEPYLPVAFGFSPSNDNIALPDIPGGGPVDPIDPQDPDDGDPPGPGDDDDEEPNGPGDDDDDDDDDDEDDDDGPGGGDDDDDDDDDEDDDDDDETVANRAPLVAGPVRLQDVFAGQVVLIGLSELLFGASDPDGDPLTIMSLTVTGTALVQTEAGWRLTTEPGMLGPVSFSYRISDGELSVAQTAHLEIVRNLEILTPGDDVHVGTPWDDDIDGLGGDDSIDGLAGNDLIVGGAGDDHIHGGEGDDHLYGNDGDDVIFGGAGNDLIGGGAGDDRLFGDAGDDTITGDAGNDTLHGDDGEDILDGGDGADALDGGTGDDVLRGGADEDTLDGGDGNDVLLGEAGDDTLVGGAGNDALDGGTGNDELDGGDGNDTLVGAAGCDELEGGAGDDSLAGGAHDDELAGEAGDDGLDGGSGNDGLAGGDGNDTLIGAAGCDELEGGAGDDILTGGADDDDLSGGTGDDTLSGGAGDDEVWGEAGDDTIIGDSGDDVLDGGDGHDTLDLTAATADLLIDYTTGRVEGDDIGADSITGIEQVNGGAGDDVFVLGATATVSSGGRGRDTFVFEVTDEDPTLSDDVVHDILDFVVGDRVRVRDYHMDREARETEKDFFKSVYADDDDDWLESELPILVRYERYDDVDHTIIQADIDRDNVYEITINVHGVQLPLTVEPDIA